MLDIKVEPLVGDNIRDVAIEAQELANRLRCGIRMEFNTILCYWEPGVLIDNVIAAYERAISDPAPRMAFFTKRV